MSAMLEVRGLSKAFGGVHAVEELGFDLHAGERLALIGPNGAGKSTSFQMLMGELRPDAGTARFEGVDLVGKDPREIWALGVGRTFQITSVFASMTVAQNVQTALQARNGESFDPVRRARDRRRDEAVALLERVGMAEQSDRPASVLAYGDVKRLEFAIALAGAPRLLLMDEPTAGMAPRERHALMDLVSGIVAEGGISVLFTEHDMDVVFGHADRIMVLDRGRLIADGAPDIVRADAKVRSVYLGSGAEAGHA
ncbi:ABC transporter ATP-binding protein [Nisaea sediminum]|uniref:ABC transporter ATP-binding protein n=1 Tax=Nisaea sediminum TaxID=2775867 RepID=UPI001867F76F|nr:ABC transporter ATP-binding protein [Nisaea sediminum]